MKRWGLTPTNSKGAPDTYLHGTCEQVMTITHTGLHFFARSNRRPVPSSHVSAKVDKKSSYMELPCLWERDKDRSLEILPSLIHSRPKKTGPGHRDKLSLDWSLEESESTFWVNVVKILLPVFWEYAGRTRGHWANGARILPHTFLSPKSFIF
jgi:hypothetical protein